MINIRPARVEAARTIAQLYVEGWQDAYPGLLPDELLVGMDADERRKQNWAGIIRRTGANERVIVAETAGIDGVSAVVGFASAGAPRRGGLGHKGEVYTLYVETDFLGRGIGGRLFATIAVETASRSGSSVIVWVLAGNPARFFYESLGGRMVGRRPGTLGGGDIEEIAYGWADASVLAARQR